MESFCLLFLGKEESPSFTLEASKAGRGCKQKLPPVHTAPRKCLLAEASTPPLLQEKEGKEEEKEGVVLLANFRLELS